MASWQPTALGGSTGVFYNKRCDVAKMGTQGAFRVTIEGIESAALPDNGVVRSLNDGRTLAMNFLKALDQKTPYEQKPGYQPKTYAPSRVEIRARMVDAAVHFVNGYCGPDPAPVIAVSTPDGNKPLLPTDRMNLVGAVAQQFESYVWKAQDIKPADPAIPPPTS